MKFLVNAAGRVPTSWIQAAGILRGRSRWIKRATDWLPAMLRGREGLIQDGLGKGLRFHGGGSAVGFLLGTHDPLVQEAMKWLLRPGMTVLDVGENVGFTALLMARQVGPEGRVICFEPLEANAALIRSNAERNGFAQIDVRNEALGRADGEAEFHLSHSPTWGRLASAGPAPDASGAARVPVRRLDSLVESVLLPRADFIKMDVEGAEADALAGARDVLKLQRPVLVIELHHTNLAVHAAFDDLNYTLRVLGSDVDVCSAGGEIHVLAYPEERADVDACWKEHLGKPI